MAKTTTGSIKTYIKTRKSRPGVHSKNKSSKMKKSRNYKKAYRAQGR